MIREHSIKLKNKKLFNSYDIAGEMKAIWILAWPAMVEFGFQSIVQYVDLYMVGDLGVDATAIVGLCSQVQFILKFPIISMSVGVLSAIAITFGEKDEKKIHRMSGQAIWYTLLLGVFFWGLSFITGLFTPKFFNLDTALRKEFFSYFFICYSTTILFTATSVFGAVLKGIGDMKTPMLINGTVNILNIVLNFFFIYKTRYIHISGSRIKVPGAGLGLDGAAIGTAVSVGIGGVLMFMAVNRNKSTGFNRNSMKFDKNIQKTFFYVGIPSGLTSLSTGLGRVIFTSLVSSIGTLTMVAHFIALTVESFFYIPAVGIQGGVTTLAGNYYGERDKKKSRDMMIAGMVITIIIMTIMGAFLFLFAKPLSGLFTDDRYAINLSTRVLKIISFSESVFGISLLVQGLLEGMGKTKMIFICSSVSMWLCRVVICYVITIILKCGLESVWLCMIADNVLRAILLFIVHIKAE